MRFVWERQSKWRTIIGVFQDMFSFFCPTKIKVDFSKITVDFGMEKS